MLIASSIGRTTSVVPLRPAGESVFDPYANADSDDDYGSDADFDDDMGNDNAGSSYGGGFGTWIKRTIGKVRETIDPEEKLEDDAL